MNVTPFGRRLRDMRVLDVITEPCRWKHAKGKCYGTAIAHNIGEWIGVEFMTSCRRGTLYVAKLRDGVEEE